MNKNMNTTWSFVNADVDSISISERLISRSESMDKIISVADSIKRNGLIYPIVVRKIGNVGLWNGSFELVCGYKRLKAFSFLGYHSVPSRVLFSDDYTSDKLAVCDLLRSKNDYIRNSDALCAFMSRYDLNLSAAASDFSLSSAEIRLYDVVSRLSEDAKDSLSHLNISFDALIHFVSGRKFFDDFSDPYVLSVLFSLLCKGRDIELNQAILELLRSACDFLSVLDPDFSSSQYVEQDSFKIIFSHNNALL